MRRISFAALAVAACALVGLPAPSFAQNYPDRPVRIMIAFSPAGAIDILGRLIADKLSEMWGQQVVVENRPGGGGNIGAAAAAPAAPDGYTLHFGAQTLGTNVTLSPTTAFHPVTSFEPIMLVGTALEIFMVANATPFQSVKEVVDYAKANPGKLNYASVGIGSSAHLATVLFMDVTGMKMQHVPYSQMSQTYADMFSGRTEIWFTTAGGSLPHIASGKVRALAVNGPSRSKLLPDCRPDRGRREDEGRDRAGTASSRRRARRRRSSTRSTATCRRSSTCPTCASGNWRSATASSAARPRFSGASQERDRQVGSARQEGRVRRTEEVKPGMNHAGVRPFAVIAARVCGPRMNAPSAAAAARSLALLCTPNSNSATMPISAGSGPTISTPGTASSSESIWMPSSASPRTR